MSERWLELVSTLLLALATIATAWSGYQAREWTGQQSQAYSRGNATRLASNRQAAIADRQGQIDVATFIAWVDADAHGDEALARFYRQRFRDEFKPPFAAWIAAHPLTNPKAPPTPFATPQYKLAASEEADRLEVVATGFSDRAKDANERANNYMLAVVIFACALFFAGISTRLHSTASRTTILTLGCLLFVGNLVWLATLPVRVSA